MKVISIRTAILAVFLLPLATIGQTFLGSMVGTITDPSGASVSDVKSDINQYRYWRRRTTLTSNTGEAPVSESGSRRQISTGRGERRLFPHGA